MPLKIPMPEVELDELRPAVALLSTMPVIKRGISSGRKEDVEIDPEADPERIMLTLTTYAVDEYRRAFVTTQRTEARDRKRKLNALFRALNEASDLLPSLHVDRAKWLNDPANDPTTEEQASADFRLMAGRAWRDAALYAATARDSIRAEQRRASHPERDSAIRALDARLERMTIARNLTAKQRDRILRAIWRAARLPDWSYVPSPDKAMSDWYRQAMARIRDKCP